MDITRIYKSTETGDYFEAYDIDKPYNVGQNTGVYVHLQMVCTSDLRNPLDVMSKEDYEEKGYEGFNSFIYSEGIDEAAKANDYEVVGDSDSSLVPETVKFIREQFYKKHYSL